jgi:hypothetical protein
VAPTTEEALQYLDRLSDEKRGEAEKYELQVPRVGHELPPFQ